MLRQLAHTFNDSLERNCLMQVGAGPQVRAKTLDLRILAPEPDLVVYADEEKLRQIMLNLLTNALKFTGTGRVIEVSARPVGPQVEIIVRDEGRGIPAARLESVFEPFIQVDRNVTASSEQGIGLGLAISRELARAMQGDLTATSIEGKGSRFVVALPAAMPVARTP